jgi:predicted metal-binding membrane protein
LPESTLEGVLKRDRLVVLASLVALAALSWLYLAYLAAGMETMDGIAGRMMGMPQMNAAGEMEQPGPVAATINFLLLSTMWIVMMVGMMLPSAAPTILLFAALERKRTPPRPYGRVALFVAGYFVAWSAFSIAAALLQTVLSSAGQISMQMVLTSGLAGGIVLILAGLYEFSPLKSRCLSHCRSPLEWIAHYQRPGSLGALRMGMHHGLYCLGCCWMLMLLLFVGGVMNLLWVAVIAAVVLVEKLLPVGPMAAKLAGAALVLFGVYVAATSI